MSKSLSCQDRLKPYDASQVFEVERLANQNTQRKKEDK